MSRRILVLMLGLLLALAAGLTYAATTYKIVNVHTATALSTELNNLGNGNTSSASATMVNTVGSAGDGSLLCTIEGTFTFAGNPTAGSSVSVWLLLSIDGTSFEDTSGTGFGRQPDVVLPVTSGQTTTRVMRTIACPTTNYKVRAKNESTGQALAASGSTIRVLFQTLQGV